MNYSLNLTRAFFATITILLTVQISGGADCGLFSLPSGC